MRVVVSLLSIDINYCKNLNVPLYCAPDCVLVLVLRTPRSGGKNL